MHGWRDRKKGHPEPAVWAVADRRTRRAALGVSCGLHLLLLAGLLLVHQGPSSREHPEASTRVRFVKAAPPRARPLSRRTIMPPTQRPLIRQQRAQARPTAAIQPAVGVGEGGSAPGAGGQGAGGGTGEGWGGGGGEGGGGFLAGLSGISGEGGLPAGSGLGFGGGGIGPGLRAGAVGGEWAGADEIDLGLELLGVEALDTGRERAVVIVDPRDRRGLKGFLYLASVHSEAIERAELDSPVARRLSTARPSGGPTRQVAERQTLQGLADRMTERTQVRVELLDGLPLDDPRLLQVPFVLLTATQPFVVTEAEAINLGRYLTAGGFVYLENVAEAQVVGNGYTSDLPALRELVRSALAAVGCREGKDWHFTRLGMDHPLFHCYYDLASLPMGFHDWPYTYLGPRYHYSPEYLEGIQLNGRLAGVYSQKDYTDFWAGEAEFIREADEAANLANGRFSIGGEELKPYDLGINVLVFALTQEGSLARRLVAAE